MPEIPSEEDRFAMYLKEDRTFWGDLFRARGVKTFEEALRVSAELKANVDHDRNLH